MWRGKITPKYILSNPGACNKKMRITNNEAIHIFKQMKRDAANTTYSAIASDLNKKIGKPAKT